MVFVLDKHKNPLDPCSEKRASVLLAKRQATVHKRAPFTIRLKYRTLQGSCTHPVRLKLDPGSKTTGFAILADSHVVVLGELVHKPGIKAALESRRSLRRGRRSRKTRYRQPRFLNRGGDKTGWLAPSLIARVQQPTLSRSSESSRPSRHSAQSTSSLTCSSWRTRTCQASNTNRGRSLGTR